MENGQARERGRTGVARQTKVVLVYVPRGAMPDIRHIWHIRLLVGGEKHVDK